MGGAAGSSSQVWKNAARIWPLTRVAIAVKNSAVDRRFTALAERLRAEPPRQISLDRA